MGIWILGVYVLTVAGLAAATQWAGGTGIDDPILWRGASWRDVLVFFYYGLPVLLALIFGLLFRPFWPHFRNLIVAVFVVQMFYSLGVYGVRWRYVDRRRRAESALKGRLRLKILSTRHRLLDRDADGLVDKIEIFVHAAMRGFPPGRYQVYAEVSQKGMTLPRGRIGAVSLTLRDGGPRDFKMRFTCDPRPWAAYYAGGAFSVGLGVLQAVPVGEDGERIVAWSRWSPFLRTTSWTGKDPEIRDRVVTLAVLPEVDRFALLPVRLPVRSVTFQGFVRDFGRDEDGDGLFESLVVVFRVDSSYAGPVFLAARFAGSPNPIFIQTVLRSGAQDVEMVVPSGTVRGMDTDGPWTLTDIRMFNQDPQCPSGTCAPRIKPFFRVYLDNYRTGAYRRDQFASSRRTLPHRGAEESDGSTPASSEDEP